MTARRDTNRGLGAIALAFIMAACAGQAPSAAPPSTIPSVGSQVPSPIASSQASSIAPTATVGGDIPEQVLTFSYAKDWSNLDPSEAFGPEQDIHSQIYENLTEWDQATSKLIPGLATSWDRNSDGTQWTFHLRSGVKFQDGAPFTADAVKLSVERTKRLDKGPAYLWSSVKQITVVDPLTVRLDLDSAAPMDLEMASAWGAWIVSPNDVDQPDTWFQQGQGHGTGPYQYESYEPGQSATLTRFADYWGGWKPGQFTKILFNITPDGTTREQSVLTGEAQVTFNVPIQDLPGLSNRPDVQVVPLNVLGIQYLLLNAQRPPLDNVKVRQALAYAFPIDDIVKTLYGNGQYGKAAVGYVPDGLWGHGPDLKGYTLDLDKARQLLIDGGQPGGGFSEDLIFTPSFPELGQIAELFQASLKEIGVTLNVRQVTSNELSSFQALEPISKRPFMFSYWIPTYATPQDYLFTQFHSKGQNVPGYKNPAVDELLDKGLAQSATDLDAAGKTFIDAQQKILDDMPGIPVVDQPEVFVAKPGITGFTPRDFALWVYGLSSTATP